MVIVIPNSGPSGSTPYLLIPLIVFIFLEFLFFEHFRTYLKIECFSAKSFKLPIRPASHTLILSQLHHGLVIRLVVNNRSHLKIKIKYTLNAPVNSNRSKLCPWITLAIAMCPNNLDLWFFTELFT